MNERDHMRKIWGFHPPMEGCKPIPDEAVKPGMIVTMVEAPGEKYEVLQARGAEKILLRREDLE